MSLIDIDAFRALVAEEVRRVLAQERGNGASPASATLPTDEGFWDADDVAKFLKASRSWVYQQAEAGRLPCRKVVGLLRFDPAMVKAFARGEPATTAKVLQLPRAR